MPSYVLSFYWLSPCLLIGHVGGSVDLAGVTTPRACVGVLGSSTAGWAVVTTGTDVVGDVFGAFLVLSKFVFVLFAVEQFSVCS